LIARAVEEGIAVIKPSGIMVFNMGGRPGQGVCERLFERRGFHITKLWQTKIMQVAQHFISAIFTLSYPTYFSRVWKSHLSCYSYSTIFVHHHYRFGLLVGR
jgi:hypothetical protein